MVGVHDTPSIASARKAALVTGPIDTRFIPPTFARRSGVNSPHKLFAVEALVKVTHSIFVSSMACKISGERDSGRWVR